MNDDRPAGQGSWLRRLVESLSGEPRDLEQLSDVLADAKDRGLIEADVLSMMEGVLQVSAIQVRDVMVPRAQMVVVQREDPPEKILPAVIESGHSRFPVVGEDRDEVVGILLAKDLLRYFAEDSAASFDIRECLRPAVFIPESKRLNVLLREFRNSHNHMAIVVDEYGGVSGLLTIEDVLEQIVGDIGDEYDVDEVEGIHKEAERTFAVPALTRIEEFNDVFDTRFSDEDADTIGGLVLHELGRHAAARRSDRARRARTQGVARRPAAHRDAAGDDAARHRPQAGRVNRADGSASPAAIVPRGVAPMLDVLGRRGRWVALAGGLALAAAFAPLGFAVLSIACPALLILLWQDTTPREAALARRPLHRSHLSRRHLLALSQRPRDRSRAAAGGDLPDAGAGRDHGRATAPRLGWLVARYAPRAGIARWMLLLPAGWILVEWLRGWLLSGFPWLSLGYAHLDTPLVGYAPVLGVYGVGLAAAVSAGALVTFLLGTRVSRIVAALSIVTIWGVGAWLTRVEWTEPRDRALSVALVQGAVPQTMKWAAGQRERTERLYLGLSRPHFGVDLVVWPEASIPALAADLGEFLAGVRAEAAAGGTALIMGLIRNEPATDAYYNADGRVEPAAAGNRAVVREAQAGAVRRVLPGARGRAFLAQADESAVLGFRAGLRPAETARAWRASGSRPRSATRMRMGPTSDASSATRRCS